jgi:hypothetical protein
MEQRERLEVESDFGMATKRAENAKNTIVEIPENPRIFIAKAFCFRYSVLVFFARFVAIPFFD